MTRRGPYCQIMPPAGSADVRASPITTRLTRAYRRTSYTAGSASIRVGQRSARLDAVLDRLRARNGGFVTAWNPLSRRMPPGWNRRMQRALAGRIRRLPFVPGVGVGRSWSEEHVFIAAGPNRLRVLARLFRQRAIVVVRRGQPARLGLLSLHRFAERAVAAGVANTRIDLDAGGLRRAAAQSAGCRCRTADAGSGTRRIEPLPMQARPALGRGCPQPIIRSGSRRVAPSSR